MQYIVAMNAVQHPGDACSSLWQCMQHLRTTLLVAPQNGCTPLHCAAVAGHLGVLQLLLASGADLSCRDQVGRRGSRRAAWPLCLIAGFLYL
jgi:hypothetical protein